MKKISYITACVVLSLLGIYAAKARLDTTTPESAGIPIQQGLPDASIVQSGETGAPGETFSLHPHSVTYRDGADPSSNPSVQDQAIEAATAESLNEESATAYTPGGRKKDGHTPISGDMEQHPQQTATATTGRSEPPESGESMHAQGGLHIQGGQVVATLPQGIPEIPSPAAATPSGQAAPGSNSPTIASTADQPSPSLAVATPSEQAAPGSNSPIIASTVDQPSPSSSNGQVVQPRAGIAWKELVMRQREISKRAFASRSALMLQAASDNQYVSQDGIEDEILRVMQ